MEMIHLGGSGLRVSPIALGCMTFGDTSSGFSNWAMDEEASAPIFRAAVDLGITFWDTANVYSFGSSEEIVGRAMRRFASREEIVLATKLYYPMHNGPGGSGNSRKAIMEQVEASLRRLGTDYIDLYQIHRFDAGTPVEETMSALHDLVRSGKVRYIGASSMLAWQFSKMQYVARMHGLTTFISMQNQYNLLQREEEREMFGLLSDQGVGAIPWSPQARGLLSRPWSQTSDRAATDPAIKRLFSDDASNRQIVGAVEAIAQARGVPMATIALAWVRSNPAVAAPIVGATKPEQLAGAAAALDVAFDSTELAALEEHYTPRLATGMGPNDKPAIVPVLPRGN